MTDQRLAIELFKRFAAWFWMPKFIHHMLNIILLWQGFRLRSYIMYHHHVISIFWKSFFLFRPFLGNFLVHFAIPFSGDLRSPGRPPGRLRTLLEGLAALRWFEKKHLPTRGRIVAMAMDFSAMNQFKHVPLSKPLDQLYDQWISAVSEGYLVVLQKENEGTKGRESRETSSPVSGSI